MTKYSSVCVYPTCQYFNTTYLPVIELFTEINKIARFSCTCILVTRGVAVCTL